MTKIFKSYSEFLTRADRKENGISEEFAAEFPNWLEMNETNEACWNCSDCSGCSGCSDCSDCSNIGRLHYRQNLSPLSTAENPIPGFPDIPVIQNIHQRIFEAVSQPEALNMSDWHTCDTTHCRAGWVVFLAGAQGKILEKHTSTEFAAKQIYKVSSSITVSPTRFYEDNEKALEDIKRCADEEAKLQASSQE